MSGFLDDYETVDTRLRRFYDKHPDGRVITQLLASDDGVFIVRAEAFRQPEDPHPAASGLAREIEGQGNVNKTNPLENCETSAVGRALANLGFSPKGQRPSREEMAATQGGEGGAGASVTPPADAPPSLLNKVKARVANTVRGKWAPPWTPKMVTDTCSRLWPKALKALELTEDTVTEDDSERLGRTVLDLIDKDGK